MNDLKAGRLGPSRPARIRFRLCMVLQVCGLLILVLSLKLGSNINFDSVSQALERVAAEVPDGHAPARKASPPAFVVQTEVSKALERLNDLPPRNVDLYPRLAKDHVKLVLYVHNRPQYLRVAVDSLSKVQGINETLLIVSHDGSFPEMNEIVDSIRFCQVKPIFAPFSPHLFPDSFPGISPRDCQGKDVAAAKHCTGNPDQYGNHRSKIVSLKHHWWWMMNTVWDGLAETAGFDGHVLFIEEDHYLFPIAYRTIQVLTVLKNSKCPYCYVANLAPLDVTSRGEGDNALYAEKIGNVGYAFNRTVWTRIHASSQDFCTFDEYNWDITMWSTVYPNWSKGKGAYTLRGPRASATHFGKCGLHQGQKEGQPACDDRGFAMPVVFPEDHVLNVDPRWRIRKDSIKGYNKAHKGWGGWGDTRDQLLCLYFSSMYTA